MWYGCYIRSPADKTTKWCSAADSKMAADCFRSNIFPPSIWRHALPDSAASSRSDNGLMQEDDATVSHCSSPQSDDNRVASFPASGKFDRVRVTSRDNVTTASGRQLPMLCWVCCRQPRFLVVVVAAPEQNSGVPRPRTNRKQTEVDDVRERHK